MASETTHPYIIAGPCSAETENQLVSAASALCGLGLDAFRAGIWKPRTHPGNFEGVGEKGIEWLVRIREEFGVKVCTEVALPEHVEVCLRAGIDMLWIGARTVANPFLVQQIADSLNGSRVPVWVKNPMAQDIELWAGAVERLRESDVNVIGLIFRGFPGNGSGLYRNRPEWGAAIEMRRRFPELKLLCDPSHISGDSGLVEDLSVKSLDLGFDGLMLEVHPEPDKALSDAPQQLSPEAFAGLLAKLSSRNASSQDEIFQSEIQRLRTVIDRIDADLVGLLAERLEISREIGELKRRNNVTILQMDRWNQVLEEVKSLGAEKGVDSELVARLFTLIHEASVLKQDS